MGLEVAEREGAQSVGSASVTKGAEVTVVFRPPGQRTPLLIAAEVTHVLDTPTVRGFVCELSRSAVFDWKFAALYGSPVLGRLFVEEGLTWCHGWEGEQVDALRSSEALA